MKINWVDIVLVIYITRAFFLGKKRGLSFESVALVSAFLAWVVALHFYQPLGRSFNRRLLVSVPAASCIAFFSIGFGMLFLGRVFAGLLKKVMKLSFTSNMEKIGGLLVGGIRGAVVTPVFVVGLSLLPSGFVQREVYINSFLGNYLVALSPKMHNWMWKEQNKTEPSFSISEFKQALPQKPKEEIL